MSVERIAFIVKRQHAKAGETIREPMRQERMLKVIKKNSYWNQVMRQKGRKSRQVLGGLMVAGLILAACGSSSPSASSISSSAKAPINLGMITSLTGPYSFLGEGDEAMARLIVDHVNFKGGYHGQKINLIIENDQSSATTAVTDLRQLESDHIIALIGPVFSSSCAAITDEVNQAAIPTVMTCGSPAPVIPVRKYVYQSTPLTPLQVAVYAKYFAAKGIKKIAFIHDNADFGETGYATWTAYTRSHPGSFSIIANETISVTGSTFLPQVTSALSAHPQAVLVWSAGPDLATIAKEYATIGSTVPLMMSGAAAGQSLFVGAAGTAANGVLMAAGMAQVWQYLPTSSPVRALDKSLAPEIPPGGFNQALDDACGATTVLTKAILNAGPNPSAINKWLLDNKVVACDGTYDYATTAHQGLTASQVWLMRVLNGKFVPTKWSLANSSGV